MMRLSELAQAVNGQLIGKDVLFTSVGTDSRNITAGQLFVALKGEHFDGHAYVKSATQQGAVAALTSSQQGQEAVISQVLVPDTRLALGQLASYWRKKFMIPVAGITGSNGKTTVKEMLASICEAHTKNPEAVLATQGNFNNDIGLPLTLLNLRQQHQCAVIEMGMNHSGEIGYLSELALPTAALINNAAAAHLGGLGSVEAIAKAKAEIYQGLVFDGVAVINADDAFAPLWQKYAMPHRVMIYGLNPQSVELDVTADYVLAADDSVLHLKTVIGKVSVKLNVAGLHNVRNALAAATTALALGIKLSSIAQGLERFNGTKGRLQHKAGLHGASIIDDTYNANPASMKAAIDVLAAKPGQKILVLGDMGELGDTALALHAEIGAYAKEKNIDALFTLGEMSIEISRAFSSDIQHFETVEALVEAVKKQMTGNTQVLVKGSRFMKMERVVALLLAQKASQGEKDTCY